tara:strand:+ start:34584 stop:36281 length:1698 start_codon:yes stop_codon:yes gene_type:complete
MTIINGGLINCGAAASASSSLALSDGLACFTGSFSGVTTTSISHNLNSSALVVEFKDSLGNLLIPDTWSITNPNVIEADFTPAATGDVTIIACIESGLAPITGGVTTVEGLSGVVDLDSPNNSIVITTSGQVINLNAIFTPASGAVLEQKCRDITILSGLIGTGGGGGVASINNISGIVTLTSTNNGLEIGVNGQSIEFTTLFTYASGQLVDQNTQDILTVSGLLGGGDAGQTSINGLSGVVSITSPNGSILVGDGPQAIQLSGLFTMASGALVQQHSADLLALSGLIFPDSGQTSINGLSGVVAVTSPDGSILIGDSLQTLELSGLFTAGSGALLRQHSVDLLTLSGLIIDDSGQTSINGISGVVTLTSPDASIGIAVNGQNIELSTSKSSGLCSVHEFTPADGTVFTVAHNLNTVDFVWNLWRTDSVPHTSTIANVASSGVNHAVVELASPINGKLVLQGCAASGITVGDSIAIRTVSDHYTMTGLDSAVLVDASTGAKTITLLNPSGVEGRSLYVKKIDPSGTSVTLNANGSGLIDGNPTAIILTRYDAVRVTAHNGNWWIL